MFALSAGLRERLLRDEIYCQLLKQTNFSFKSGAMAEVVQGTLRGLDKHRKKKEAKSMKNIKKGNVSSRQSRKAEEVACTEIAEAEAHMALRGWEMLVVCTTCFPPSRPLQKVVAAYLLTHAGAAERAQKTLSPVRSAICELAMGSLDSLQKLLKGASRKEACMRQLPPSLTEIRCIVQASPPLCRCHTLNGMEKGVFVDSHTKIREVFGAVADQVGMRQMSGFGMYEVLSTGDGEASVRWLEDTTLVVDSMAQYERETKEERVKSLKYELRRSYYTR